MRKFCIATLMLRTSILGIADTKEYETTALAEVLLYTRFTIAENFVVNSQYLENGTEKIRLLDINEAKRASTNQPFSLKALEKQARKYCKIYLESDADVPYMYAATWAGAHVRLWKYWREQPDLVPIWGANTVGDWSEYKDVGDDQAGGVLEYWFGQMKQLPPTPHAGQTMDTYGTPSTAGLSYQQSASSYPGYTSYPYTPNNPASTFSYPAPTSSDPDSMSGIPASGNGPRQSAQHSSQ
ncbi:hypothetical protein BKA61DRAFT_734846 [Leptodontidium sp. MPI-SDFR-AT-0119]|nr:hypothetical protein BKA61DRAFT_734846 [Leptodontidium sp. MPI-SDFR-AT-0119]